MYNSCTHQDGYLWSKSKPIWQNAKDFLGDYYWFMQL